MHRLFYLTLSLLFCTLYAYAQKRAFTGTVADSASKERLEMATVTVQDNKDSSLISYTLTDRTGAFSVPGIPAGQAVRVLISYTGYRTFIKVIQPSESAHLGHVSLAPSATNLNTVTIEGDRPPISIRKDTIEFNAAAFKTKPNAVVEDLLKRLPGVDVDEEGNITVNGKKVSRILVDGREFFGNDPKLASKHLPSAIIDKVQVMDTKTRQEGKLGIEKDGEDKTINVTLKADKKKGVFGRVTAGGGTDDRFEGTAFVNGFYGPKRLSVLAGTNNLNKITFSQSELTTTAEKKSGSGFSVMVSDGGLFTMNGINFGIAGDGIRTATIAGFNYNDQWGKNTYPGLNYFVNNVDSRVKTVRNQEYNDGRQIFSNRTGFGTNINHRLNFSLDADLDSMTNIVFRPTIDYTKTSTEATSLDTTWTDGQLLNDNKATNRNAFDKLQLQMSLELTRQLRKKGRSIAFTFSASQTNQDGTAYNFSDRQFYQGGDVDSTARTNQFGTLDSRTGTYDLGLRYTEPLSKAWRLTAGYAVQFNNGRSKRYTYNYDETDKSYTDFDSLYSNEFKTNIVNHNPTVSFNYTKGAWSASLGGGAFMTTLDNYSVLDDQTIRQYQANLAPRMNVNYKTKKNANISVNYNGNMRQPTLEQLQPIRDNSNTLNIRIGNPDLKPQFSHNFGFGLNKFNPKGGGIFMGMNFTPVDNKITTLVKARPDGSQVSQFVNVDGTYNAGGYLSMSKSKKSKDYNLKVNFSLNLNGGKNITFTNINNVKSDTTIRKSETFNMWIAPSVFGVYSYKELLEVALSFRPSFNLNKYPANVTTQGNFVTYRSQLSTTLNWPKNISWDNDLGYQYNSRTAPGFRKGVVMWHMGVAYDFLKNKQAQVKLYAYDLLRQSTSLRRFANELYVEDVQTQVVEQYFMLSFTYNISMFGGKAKPSRGVESRRGLFMF
ncbi:TonB-dependent receptor domain-containing protein [Chitinophaga lutea]